MLVAHLFLAKQFCAARVLDAFGLHRVTDQRRRPHPVAAAMEWVAKITTVGLEMFLPAVGGGYLDRYLGTGYWAVVGLIVGVVVGFLHLLQMTRTAPPKQDQSKGGGTNGGSADA